MAYLFKVTSGKSVYPTEEALLTSPFKEIWKRDKNENKEQAIAELAYIEFVTSMKKTNPYRQYPEKRKKDVVKLAVMDNQDWIEDDLIVLGMAKIIKFQKEASTTYLYYISAKIAAEEMQNFFRTVDITKKNAKTGLPIYKPRDITSALNDTAKVLANLKQLEKKVEEEIYEEMKIRSNKKISFFADPESLDYTN